MSKEPDKEAIEAAGGGEAPHRRRRKSGLRVPSDNVPRQGRKASILSVPTMSDEAASMLEEELDMADSDAPAELDNELLEPDDGASPGDVSGDGDAVPVLYEEDPPAIHARAITQDLLESSEPALDDPAFLEEDAAALQERKTVEMTALGFGDVEETPQSEDVDPGDSVDIPIEEDEQPVAPPVQQKGRRASTMSLSDDDIEELIEPGDMAVLGGRLAAGVPFTRSDRIVRRFSSLASADVAAEPAAQPRELDMAEPLQPDETEAGDEDPQIAEDEPVRPTLRPSSDVSFSLPSSMSLEESDPDDIGIPAAVAAIEGRTIEAPVDAPIALADTSDSGEILEDDMLEEVSEPDVRQTHEAQLPPTPPPAPRASPAAPRKPPPSPKPAGDAMKAHVRPRKGKPWFEEIFDEDYLRTLPFLTPQATQSEALFVASALETEPGAQLLDVGCGYGRHAMELAARGYQVVALDLSLPLLLRGADEAQRRGLNINFVHGDMRELSFEGQFDGAYCLFSTFGYFDDETNKKTAQGIARALRPGARLVIEVLNRDYLIADLPTRVWWEGDGCVVLEEVEFNYFSSRIESNRSVVFDDGRQLEQEISLRAYSLHEFGKLLHSVGFRVLEISGSMATRGRFFGNHSREIIVVAEKRASRETLTGMERLVTPVPDDDLKRS